MENRINFTLKPQTVESLQVYAQMLDKDISSLIEEALERYFVQIQEQMLEKNMSDENAMTSLDYDEFWDGLEI